jgi:hypothetical protein
MSILDQIKDRLLGANDWRARLAGSIQLISPEGNEFTAKWRGSNRSIDKKLGIYVYPKVKGNIVQDLDVNSDVYVTTIFFEGKNADLDSQAFMGAIKQTGPWIVTHPTRGFIELQPIRVTENDQPVDSGGLYAIDTEWIEPIDPETLLTARELAGIIDEQANQLDATVIDQIVANIDASTEALKNAVDQATNIVSNASDLILGPLAATVDAIDNSFNAVQTGIQATLNETVLEVESLGGQIQQLIQLPLLATNDINARLGIYDDLSNEIISKLPTGNTAKDKNQIAIYELSLAACLSAYGRIMTTGIVGATAGAPERFPIKTRTETVNTAIKTIDFFALVTESLDESQVNFENTPIDLQYFSQSRSFGDALILIGQTVKYLLVNTFDLRIEKRFTLPKPMTPIELTVSEYGSLGDNDELLDFFLTSNELTNTEILLLPPGKEVVVYI